MAIYEVYIAPTLNITGSPANIKGAPTQFESLSALKLVEDKKHIWALAFPILWLAWNRLWFWLAIYILLAISFSLLSNVQIPLILSLLTIIPGVFLFLEGGSLIVAKLERQGWRLADVIDAPDVQIAEHKFLAKQGEYSQQENHNLPIDSLAEPIISVSTKNNQTNQFIKSKTEDRPMIGIFSES